MKHLLGRRLGVGQGAREGFALIEMTVAGSVLLIGALAFVQLFAASSDVGRSNRETAFAVEAARSVLERLEGSGDHAALFALHNADPGDDPAGLAPLAGFTGSGFTVDGLAPAPNDPDGLVGEVLFPVDPGTGELREDLALPALGMPRDLDGDGAIDGDDHAGDYVLLPVLVRVRWDSRGTTRSHEVGALLSPR